MVMFVTASPVPGVVVFWTSAVKGTFTTTFVPLDSSIGPPLVASQCFVTFSAPGAEAWHDAVCGTSGLGVIFVPPLFGAVKAWTSAVFVTESGLATVLPPVSAPAQTPAVQLTTKVTVPLADSLPPRKFGFVCSVTRGTFTFTPSGKVSSAVTS